MVNSRKAIEMLYTGTCNTFEFEEVRDTVTKITKHQEVPKLINQPCKLSFQKINTANQTESAALIAVTGKLFISPDIVITPGSKIVIIQNEKTTAFKSSGEPAIYGSHQEVILELFKGWS